MITVRQNSDLRYLVVKHTATSPGTYGQDIQARAVSSGLFGAQYDILVNANGSIDLTPVWIYAETPSRYLQRVSAQAILAYSTHYVLDTSDPLLYIQHAVSVGVVGNFDRQAPSPAQVSAVLKIIQLFRTHFPDIELLYDSAHYQT